VLLRLTVGSPWPVLIAAVRDEFLGRPWDPPAAHWPGIVGGRDQQAGGTWLAVDPAGRAAAALLNGPRLPEMEGRPSRGGLVLDVLSGHGPPDDVSAYDAFHLLHVTPIRAELWSWDGSAFTHGELGRGDHVLVNAGPDVESAVVSAGRSALDSLPSPGWGPAPVSATQDAWGPWVTPLEAAPSEEEGRLLVRREFDGKTYGSSSVSLLALGPGGVRYDFSAVPAGPRSWARILPE
jgi:Transport and Golgi organisation 2